MTTPQVIVSTTPEGMLGVALMNGNNSIVVLVAENEGLADLIGWALTAQAAELIQTAIQTPPTVMQTPAKERVS